MKKNVPERNSPDDKSPDVLEPTHTIARVDERRFSQELDELIGESESMRMRRMHQHRARTFWAVNLSILCIVAGASAFGWYFLVKLNIGQAAIWLIASLALAALVYIWADLPVKAYKREHKSVFMPKLAKALNGLQYHPARGINAKILEKLAVLPAHNTYKAEDCFMGLYKGVKVIFSEARLYSNSAKGSGPVFQGIFVLLEIPNEAIEGHTIITANSKMVQSFAKTRWKNMSKVYFTPSNPDWDIFQVYSTKPDIAEMMVGDRLVKELAEASFIFNKAPLTAVLFGRKFVFIMIPHEHDMFEASDMYAPVTTRQHALTIKKEIEQILEIIDVFEIYKPLRT